MRKLKEEYYVLKKNSDTFCSDELLFSMNMCQNFLLSSFLLGLKTDFMKVVLHLLNRAGFKSLHIIIILIVGAQDTQKFVLWSWRWEKKTKFKSVFVVVKRNYYKKSY